jgi:hypothetical protein
MQELYKDLEFSIKNRSESEQVEFNRQMEDKYRNMSIEEIEASLPLISNRIKELKVLVDLGDVTEIVSISYIAKKYFNKSRAWLAQRINGNIVNGKPAQFSADELDTLKKALEDISLKMQDASSKIKLA